MIKVCDKSHYILWHATCMLCDIMYIQWRQSNMSYVYPDNLFKLDGRKLRYSAMPDEK